MKGCWRQRNKIQMSTAFFLKRDKNITKGDLKMAQEDNMQVVMGIIMQAGNAKAAAMQAITAAKAGDFDKADEFVKQANKDLVNAHNVQTDMLTKEAQGDHVKVDLYMVHAQDHLMTAITFIDLAKEIVELYKKIDEKD